MTQITNKLTFAERTAQSEMENNAWRDFSSQRKAKFYPDNLRRTLKDLGESVFPNDDYNSKAYQEAVLEGLAKTISEEIGVQDFWGKMTDLECEFLEIENGLLNFYSAEGTKIDISPFTKKIVFEAKSSYYKQRQKERIKAMAEAKAQLENLRKEIFKR